MKWRHAVAGLCFAVLLTAAGSTVHAQVFTITITVDEDGHGTLTNSNNFFANLPFAVQPDPGPGGLPNALTYNLLGPPGLVVGDLLLFEPGSLGQLSDLIRFNAAGNGSMVFYSDTTDGADSLADVGFPTALYTNTFSLVETGPEVGPNGIVYTPTAGQPGFVAGAGGPVTYVIQSDPLSVPEPGPLVLGSVVSCVGLVLAWRRRQRAAA
jgi:hypothetical protein